MIGISIYAALHASTSLTAIVDDRIFPVVIPQEETRPSIVYAILGNDPDDTKTRPSYLDTYYFEVVSVSKTYSEVDSMAAMVRTTLEAYAGNVNIQSISYKTESDDYDLETKSYLRISQFYIRIKRT